MVDDLVHTSHVNTRDRRRTMLLLAVVFTSAARQTMHKLAARANRLASLLRKETLTVAETKELAGLRDTDTYREDEFSLEHAAFKSAHNEILLQLATYACGNSNECSFFYLDGPGGGTSKHLIEAGVERRNLYTANWHPQTVVSLRQFLPEENIATARADEALRHHPRLATLPFAALYIDGCGGAPEPVIGCVDALFHEQRALPSSIAFGFTLTTAERTGRSLADREVDVHRALATACRRRGYHMLHVADEPTLYGVDSATKKREGNTLTSWHMLCEAPEV